MKFSVAIPTYNREKDLSELLESILKQSVKPEEVIIIDDGNLSADFIQRQGLNFKEKGVDFIYYKKDHSKERRGLSESKNIGLKLARNEIIFILDDDLELEDSFFEEIMKIWKENENEKKLIGVGGWIKNQRNQTIFEKIFNRIFGLSSKNLWDVNDVGYQVWDTNLKSPKRCYYFHGGVASYRKNLVENLGGFETFLGGRTALEDVEFSLKAKKSGFYFIINPQAKVFHKQSEISKESDFLIGFKESQNRKIIFEKHCKKDLFHKIWFFWASFGWILRQFLAANFKKGLGMTWGFLKPAGKV